MRLNAQATNGGLRWLVPSNNLAAARSNVRQPEFFKIATNTPAFEEYAVNLMLEQANKMRTNWNLDIPKPLTIDDISFSLQATPYGIWGIIGTRDGRFDWGFDRNGLQSFSDYKHYPQSFRHHGDEEARLAKVKSLITANEAGEIAHTALHKLGLNEEQLHLKTKVEVNQYKFEETNGMVYPLPCFNVVWRVKGSKQYAAEDMEFAPITLDISGTTKNVVRYFNTMRIPQLPMPTNYFQMLNLPTNYLDTLPAWRRSLLGLPKLTNSPPQTTNLLK